MYNAVRAVFVAVFLLSLLLLPRTAPAAERLLIVHSALNLLTSDGVHMNPAGNQLMAFTIMRGLGVPEKDLWAAKDALKK